ncbi:MAG: type VI secretion system-associated FHA domain protein TagH [Tabrizicola sp.]|uniref:type VI secretion system-associated FHA domain protein TagH n=1 Tax=Tabrizicola sp. TaxID=2005166 RepID=UPI002ABBE6A4|nr:type VI secretion system-associated FHA domain protein TagH [Tabrizicola sp.]MDZ4087826.1 type VI secretion system-associated FHA domain protein TagH [Tabrizicola sp.]
MTLRLTIEHSPHPQDRREMRHPGGEFSIGRGAECSWQIHDPDMYVSRKHCVITGEAGQFIVTDASRGGLFIDGKDQPLGPGNAARLETGMRLRLGDTVIRVEIEAATPVAPPRTHAPVPRQLTQDEFFSAPVTPPPPVHRPQGLPQPFETGPTDARRYDTGPDRSAPPPLFDDPFTLDRSVAGRPAGSVPEPIAPRGTDFGFGSFFDEPAKPRAPEAPSAQPATPPASDDWWAMPPPVAPEPPPPAPEPPAPEPTARYPQAAEPLQPIPEAPGAAPVIDEENRTRQRGEPAPPPPAPPAPVPPQAPAPTDAALRDAFFRGLGLAPGTATDPEAEMEAMGQRFRLLVEGLLLMLRTRAREKQNARVAQTVISNTDVNPLKFLATTNEAIAALVSSKGPGYLDPDTAINGAFRDLADHQVRSWVGVQSALRRMIDRFDPAAVEKDLEDLGMLESLLSGGRNAKLWKAYTDRYKDIARAAEDRFLGEVGADFRDAYEGNREKTNDP